MYEGIYPKRVRKPSSFITRDESREVDYYVKPTSTRFLEPSVLFINAIHVQLLPYAIALHITHVRFGLRCNERDFSLR